MNKHYNMIIFGATFLAAQIAARDPENTLIVEKGIMTGGDFCTPIIPCSLDTTTQTTDFARAIAEDSSNRNMENDPISLAYCLAKAIKDAEIKVLFGTTVIKNEKQDSKFIITIHNEQGFSEIDADCVIDTTSVGVDFKNPANAKSSFAAILKGKMPTELPQGFEAAKLKDDDLLVLRVYCDPDFTAARKLIYDFVSAHSIDNRPMVVSFAKEFAWHYEKPYLSGGNGEIIFCPSVSYGDPWNALRGGSELEVR